LKHLLASWGKKKEKNTSEGKEKERKEKKDRAFARLYVEFSAFMLSNKICVCARKAFQKTLKFLLSQIRIV